MPPRVGSMHETSSPFLTKTSSPELEVQSSSASPFQSERPVDTSKRSRDEYAPGTSPNQPPATLRVRTLQDERDAFGRSTVDSRRPESSLKHKHLSDNSLTKEIP